MRYDKIWTSYYVYNIITCSHLLISSYKNTQAHSCNIYSQCFLSWASQQHDLIFITCWIRQNLNYFNCNTAVIKHFFHLPSMNLTMDNIDHNLCSIHVEWNRVVLKAKMKSNWIKSEIDIWSYCNLTFSDLSLLWLLNSREG